MFTNQRFDKLRSYDLCLNGGLLGVTVVVLIIVYFAALRPLDVCLQEASEQSHSLQELIQRASDLAMEHQSLEADLAAAQKVTADLLLRIPSSPRESDFLAQVCGLADETGLRVSDYHPGSVDDRETHHEMEVKVSMRGTYESLCKFLQHVDHVPRLCRLTQFDVATASKADDLSIEMFFRIYFAPSNKSESNQPDPVKKGETNG